MATSEAGKGQSFTPVLGTPDDLPEVPDRPQRQGRLVVHIVIGVLVAIAAGGWGYVMYAATGDSGGVSSQVISFDASRADSAEITYEIHKPSDQGALCRLRALDTDHAEVGSREVTIPAGEAYVVRTERVSTTAKATAVHVQYCYLV
ncbi:hypothetical protein Misp01_24790 [Microtetraspora sp. NBRC 13810]|uniref:DUF4307 domain-containing protein n=1 Tax=Microtetraspora sp. NBRC 13810 TaxID=3030990 RepID=UPI0024A38E62|nr:DUF4307 domain-containing protein [Microtetraspora sp. NBRC 13810]GLW07349.1 hypothetical protein Misp01_24790 [Microtetraspora sp. NBRC 13810]